MLILSRQAGESLFIGGDYDIIITVLHLFPDRMATTLLINQTSANEPGRLAFWTVDLKLDETAKVDEATSIALVDLRVDKVRLGVTAPKGHSVHRLEVYEAIKRENQAGGKGRDPDSDDGLAGAPVPKAPWPMPPSLDVRLKEPRADDGE